MVTMWMAACLAAAVGAEELPPNAGLATGVVTSASAVGISLGGGVLLGALAPASDTGFLTDQQAGFLLVGVLAGHTAGIELGTRWAARRYGVEQRPLRRGAWLGTAAGLSSVIVLQWVSLGGNRGPSRASSRLGLAAYSAGPGAGAALALTRSGPSGAVTATGGAVPSFTIRGRF